MRPPRARLALVVLVLSLWALAIGARLYDVQVSDHSHYGEKAEEQQQRVVELNPPRGTIYDARGRELAISVQVESAFAVPIEVRDGRRERLVDPAPTAAAIARVLGLDAEEREQLRARLARDRRFVWVARKLDPPRAEALRALELEGISFVHESKRYYPLRGLAAPVLGYVGTDDEGLGGLEALFDDVVASEPGRRTVMRDARFGTVLTPDLEMLPPTPGQDLHLTLDAAIQYLVERELAAAVEKHRARRGSVVVMEAHTGAILAMASHPGFDPNRFDEYPEERWRNLPVMDAYEPGSTLKMVTLAAALEGASVRPEDVVDCGMGAIVLGKTRINDHKRFGLLSVREVIAKSSNVGAVRTGLAAGGERFYATLRAFGFGRVTGVDLPGESPGILRPFERWSQLTTAYLSFGQGISVTPLQLTAAFAAIANGGTLLKPYVVAAKGRGGELERRSAREVVGIPISPSSVREVTAILEQVVTDGTAKAAQIPGYRVAGKTGTAQKAIPGRGYSPTRHVASFVGFAPVGRPEVVCLVVLDEPWPAYHGGEVAAPTFAAIVGQVLLYLGVPPQRPAPELWPGEPPPAPALPEAAPPPAGESALAAAPVPPTPPGTLPDLTGLSARHAVERLAAVGLEPRLVGHGRVARQQPAAGTPIEAAGGGVEVWLEGGLM